MQFYLRTLNIDHCAGVAPLLRTLAAKNFPKPIVYAGHEEELRKSISIQASYFGLDSADYENCPEPDIYFTPKMKFRVAGLELEARFTPGHSPGHFSLILPEDEYQIIENDRTENVKASVALAGDALFKGSIGRTDFPGCSSELLLTSIRSELFSLPTNTIVLPGHGPQTNVGYEIKFNPFLIS